MKDIFHFIQKTYNLRNGPELQRRRNRTMYFGTESISLFAPRIRKLISSDFRNVNSPERFNEKIKQSSRQQINVLASFVKRTLALWVSFNSVVKK